MSVSSRIFFEIQPASAVGTAQRTNVGEDDRQKDFRAEMGEGIWLAAKKHKGRKLKEWVTPRPVDPAEKERDKDDNDKVRIVIAKEPAHVFHIDMTEVPITGLWIPWLPFALPQVWRNGSFIARGAIVTQPRAKPWV